MDNNKRSDYQMAPNYELLIGINARFMHSVYAYHANILKHVMINRRAFYNVSQPEAHAHSPKRNLQRKSFQ